MTARIDRLNDIQPVDRPHVGGAFKEAVATLPGSSTDAHIRSLDRPLHGAVARLTGGISPAALTQAYTDWYQYLLFSTDRARQESDRQMGALSSILRPRMHRPNLPRLHRAACTGRPLSQ